MQGLGSTYLTLTTFGTTLVGVIVIISSLIGISLASTGKGKVLWLGVGLIGGAIIWASTKTRTHISQNSESSNKYGMVVLGLFVFGGITKAISNAFAPKVLPTRGGFEPQTQKIPEETEDDLANSTEGDVTDESN